MATHPTQSHVLCTGNEDGSMQIWDMRQDNQPVSLLDGCHTAAVTELLFHPSNPDFMFTCSLDGSVLQWDSSALRNAPQHQIATPSGKFITFLYSTKYARSYTCRNYEKFYNKLLDLSLFYELKI